MLSASDARPAAALQAARERRICRKRRRRKLPPSIGKIPSFSRTSSPTTSALIRDTARAYAQEKLLPRVIEAYLRGEDRPRDLQRDGRAGPARRHASPRSTAAPAPTTSSYGLVAREVERVDSGYRSMNSVQSSLVMYPIYAYGSEAQREKYLPKLGSRRVGRLLRPDRARRRLRSRRHDHARREGVGRLPRSPAPRCGSPTRRSPTCSWCGPSRRRTTTPSAASCSRRA